MSSGNYVSFLIVPEEGGKTVNFRIHRVVLRIILSFLALIIIVLIVAGVFYSSLVREAAQASRLRVENQMLLEQSAEIVKLKRELDKNRQFVNRIAVLAGIEGFSTTDSSAVEDSIITVTPGADADSVGVPSGYPLRGYISKRFSESGLFGEKHLGLDITCPEGTMIRATADGVVESAGWDDYFGYTVRIQHPGGYTTVYAHSKELRVKAGDRVKRGQIVALSGSSGRSTGPHLHYEVLKDGKSLDPEDFL